MPEKENTTDIKEKVKEFSNYLVDFLMSVLIGLGIAILLDMPIKFTRIINPDLGHFIVHLLSTCIALYVRSYRRGYHVNSHIRTFRLQKALLFVGITFSCQIILAVFIGNTVYFSGPTHWLSSYVVSIKNPGVTVAENMLAGYSWLFMLLAEVFIYAPIMILGEYFGDKQNKIEHSQISNT